MKNCVDNRYKNEMTVWSGFWDKSPEILSIVKIIETICHCHFHSAMNPHAKGINIKWKYQRIECKNKNESCLTRKQACFCGCIFGVQIKNPSKSTNIWEYQIRLQRVLSAWNRWIRIRHSLSYGTWYSVVFLIS